MLPATLFQPHEPRAVYPVFADRENRLAYVLRATYIAKPKAALRHVTGRILRRGNRMPPSLAMRMVSDSLRGIRLRFRGAFLDRDGRVLAQIPPFAEIRYRQGFDVLVNALVADRGVEVQDGQFLLIADRGVKLDGGYSIGTVTAAYLGDGFTCYRNAAFARPINEFSHHRPVGFRSIAPHMVLSGETEASAYFFNFSSDPSYDFTACPTLTLLRDDGAKLTGTFGQIPPFGARERSLTEMFGEATRPFLAGSAYATLIAEQPGVTLGSIHLIRNRARGGMSIEHTRPTHMYVA